MNNKTYILIFVCLILIRISAIGQIRIDNIKSISITDKVNWNYDRINSFNWEIRFSDSVELWYTKQISRAEFQQEIYKKQTDSLYSNLNYKRTQLVDKDSLRFLHNQMKEIIENAYLSYCDTVKPQFVKFIPRFVIGNLLTGLQDTTYDIEKFKNKNQLIEGISYGNDIIMTSYYPLIGMTIISTEGDTLIVYNEGQQDLMIPWYNKQKGSYLYNPLINFSLNAILPEDMNYNKKRLTNGLKK